MSMTDQTERCETFLNDLSLRNKTSGEATTFRTFAESDANQARGRYSAELATTVVGTTEFPPYPAASGPFQRDPVPDEPPLGFSVPRPEPIVASPLVRATPTPAALSTPLDIERVGAGFSSPQRFRSRPVTGSTSSNFPDVALGVSLHRRF
jgi:hypothetical protein